jgi:hypothetical protein
MLNLFFKIFIVQIQSLFILYKYFPPVLFPLYSFYIYVLAFMLQQYNTSRTELLLHDQQQFFNSQV